MSHEQHPPFFEAPPAEERSPRPGPWLLAVAITAVVAAAVVLIAVHRTGHDAAVMEPTVPAGPTASARSVERQGELTAVTEPDRGTTIGAGVYEVGVDVAPGRYRTPGPDRGSAARTCVWRRLSDDSGEPDSVIARGVTGGPGSVTVNAGEFVDLSGTCVWTRVGT